MKLKSSKCPYFLKLYIVVRYSKNEPCENLHPFTFFLQGVYYRSSYLDVRLIKQSPRQNESKIKM
jgi:hypothetical protein